MAGLSEERSSDSFRVREDWVESDKELRLACEEVLGNIYYIYILVRGLIGDFRPRIGLVSFKLKSGERRRAEEKGN